MSLYLFQDNQQTGPFNDEQILRMLQSGTVNSSTLAWKEGMASWVPLQTVMPRPGQSNVIVPPPRASRSVFGTISFVFALISLPAWAAWLITAGLAQTRGTITPSFNMVVGLLFLLGVFLNLLALIFGIIGSFQSQAKTFSIVGACINALVLIGLVVLIIIGVAAKGGHV